MSKPCTLLVRFEGIPMLLKQTPRWVLWRLVEVGDPENRRWSKMPLQASGQAASSTRPDTWTDFLSAQAAYETGRFDGVGFVFDGSDGLVGVDLDDCYDPDLGAFTNAALQHIAETVPGHLEVSPSGTGVKIFTLARLESAHVDHDRGLEIYPRGRYFTVTGHHLGGTIPAEPQDLSHLVPARTVAASGDDFADYSPPLEGYDLARVESEVLPHLDPDCGYTDWLTVGMALHHQFGGDVEACEAWDRWSAGDGSVPGYSPGACDRKWQSFTRGGGATLRSLLFRARQGALRAAIDAGQMVLDQAPMTHARRYLEACHTGEEGTTLVHYANDFFEHRGTHYEMVEEGTVRSRVYRFLDRCHRQDRKGNVVPFDPNPAAVTAAMDATKALVHLENRPNTRPPVWLEGYQRGRPDASRLISLQNGLFHIDERVLLPHSLGFFTQNSLPFPYDPAADCPGWRDFLSQIWPDDQGSIDCLQEIFGYILSGDTRQQKFFNIIGPRRSGKGTINKVLVALLGQHNTVAPELAELTDTFGLQPWLGKLLASFTDARAPERNRNAVVSQLLRIVGGDTVTVNRKNRDAWNGYLPTRIVVYSNELLQVTENSNALTGRMIVLRMTKSFYGREDTELSGRLMTELSGVFNWGMEGLSRRLARGGHFLQPASGVELVRAMEEMSNPVGSFFEDVAVLDQSEHVTKEDMFAVYRRWCHSKNLHAGTEQSFKKRFMAATQDLPIESTSRQVGARRRQVYAGVRLTDRARAYLDSIAGMGEEPF